jgi:hypothetical protein
MLKVITITRDRISDLQLPWIWNITCHLKLTIKITLDARVLQLNHEILWYFNTGDSRSQCWDGRMAVTYNHLLQESLVKADVENVSLRRLEARNRRQQERLWGKVLGLQHSFILLPYLALYPYMWRWAGRARKDTSLLDWVTTMLPHCGLYDLQIF